MKARVLARNGDGYSKLRQNLLSPIDSEFAVFLRDHYLPFRARRWGFGWDEGPLFPTENGRGYWDSKSLQVVVLDPVLRHLAETTTGEERAAWEEAIMRGHPRHISPGGFRHFFTSTLERFGVPREWQQRLRGDTISGADEAYRHLEPAQLWAHYRIPTLLA